MGGQVQLVPGVVARSLVVYKLITFLINTVVCQVDEVVGNLFWIVCVFFSSKSNKTFFINVQLDRVNTGQEHVQGQFKFQTSD